jgi:uncharacterized membrane protein
MATIAASLPPNARPSLAPTLYERLLAFAAALLLVAVVVAMAKGRGEWGRIPPFVWAHLATIVTALVLTPVMLLRRRGDRLHRRLGWVWSGAMFLTAALSFWIRGIGDGRLSYIHILSALTLASVPWIVWLARRHNVEGHRRAVRGLITGALVVAGIFTLHPERTLGHFLFG